MNTEKFQELWHNGDLVKVDEELDDSWRHGNYVTTVYRYENEFWQADYHVSGDAEYHGIRDNDFKLTKVYPVTKITKTTEYVTTPQRPVSPTRYTRKFHDIEAIQFPLMPATIDLFAGEMEEWTTNIELFEDWLAVNISPGQEIKYRGNKLVVRHVNVETEYPGGTWLIKEPGRSVYPLSPDKFEALYEKA
jgi:hypothetical protein